MNYLVHSFGQPSDYTYWPRGWSYPDFQPYFQRVLSSMNVDVTATEDKLMQAMLVAQEVHNGSRVSFSKAAHTISQGTRWSTYHAYLQKSWGRPNLDILQNAVVTKVGGISICR